MEEQHADHKALPHLGDTLLQVLIIFTKRLIYEIKKRSLDHVTQRNNYHVQTEFCQMNNEPTECSCCCPVSDDDGKDEGFSLSLTLCLCVQTGPRSAPRGGGVFLAVGLQRRALLWRPHHLLKFR